MSLREAAEQMGIDKSVVGDWVRVYQAEGKQSFLPREGNRRYDPILKESAVKDYLSGRGSIRDICKKYKANGKNLNRILSCRPCTGGKKPLWNGTSHAFRL